MIVCPLDSGIRRNDDKEMIVCPLDSGIRRNDDKEMIVCPLDSGIRQNDEAGSLISYAIIVMEYAVRIIALA